MKQINKISEPKSLVQHRAKTFATFENIPLKTKDELRQNLLSEQGHICCYCMKRIPEQNAPYMKIEHHKCQDNYETMQLTYSNLFGACTGNEGQPKIKQTCDTKKGNLDLFINPISNAPTCETLFKYNSEGEISSINDDININKQLNDILNLNMQTLKDGRSAVYLEVQKRVKIESKNKATFAKFLEQEKTRWMERTDNKFKPYCQVAIYYLMKKIKSHQK